MFWSLYLPGSLHCAGTVKGQKPPYYVMLQFLHIFRQLDTEVSEKESVLTVKFIAIFWFLNRKSLCFCCQQWSQ